MPIRPSDGRTLYKQYYSDRYREFTLSDAQTLSLPGISWVPWRAASTIMDKFTKKHVAKAEDAKITTIKKNNKHHALLWTTDPKKIKEGVRWGIIKTESITGQVIGTLGHYRIAAHERIAKGMVSDTQALKIELLDLYQERMEALQGLESLVNTKCDVAECERVIGDYIKHLKQIQEKIKTHFYPASLKEIAYEKLPHKLSADMGEDIVRAEMFLRSVQLRDEKYLRSVQRARGKYSILQFVKQQMHRNLYEFQGVNQDIVFSKGALTRGELNDYIEDARKVIDDHKPDLRDAATAKHHGDFTNKNFPEEDVTYDFSLDGLSYEQEYRALLAISFIEGKDRVDYRHENGPRVYNSEGQYVNLTTISATKWRTHRDFSTAARYFWEYSKNWMKGLFKKTRPWEDKILDSNSQPFELYATTLKKFARSNAPIWKKFLNVLYDFCVSIKNVFVGIYNFGKELILDLPEAILSDWYSASQPRSFRDVLQQADKEIIAIAIKEENTLGFILDQVISKDKQEDILTKLQESANSTLAQPDYHLVPAEDRDLLTAATEGFAVFASHFTHDLFTKDPIGGLVFTTAFTIGGSCILFPAVAKTIFPIAYVDGFATFAKLVGSSPLPQALYGGMMQAQIAQVGLNTVIDGPSCLLAHVAEKFIDNPMPAAFAFGAAYGLGYAFVNLPIPVFHELIQEELGSSALLNDPVIGIKLMIVGNVIFHTGESYDYHPVQIKFQGNEVEQDVEYQQIQQTISMVRWLNTHSRMLHKLDAKTRLEISQQLDSLFKPEQAVSLKKLLYPVNTQSIAYYLIAIPLEYVSSVFRLGVAIMLSTVAALMGHYQPGEPIRRAGSALFQKITKDLTRLNAVSANLLAVMVSVVSSPFKALLSAVILLVGRIASFGAHPGHVMHKAIAKIHARYREIGEALYPARLMKRVVSADPAHTVNEVLGSYGRFLQDLGINPESISEKKDGLGDSISSTRNFSRSRAALFQECQKKVTVVKDENVEREITTSIRLSVS